MKHNSINIFLLKISVIKQSIYKSNKHIQTLFVLLNPTQWSWLDIFMSQTIKKKIPVALREGPKSLGFRKTRLQGPDVLSQGWDKQEWVQEVKVRGDL